VPKNFCNGIAKDRVGKETSYLFCKKGVPKNLLSFEKESRQRKLL
jgi:hypothetical protein